MSRQDKALKRLFTKPSDYSWSELVALMTRLGFALKVTGGSHRKFIHGTTKAVHFICEPHPSNVLKAYQVRDVIVFLKDQGIDESNSQISRV